MKYTIKHNGNDYEVAVKRTAQGIVVTHDANEYVITELESDGVAAPIATTTVASASTPVANSSPAPTPTLARQTPTAPATQATPSASGGAGQVAAPMTGVIKTVHVSAGDAVTNGQVVVTMEAMKMDITIEAKTDGAVATISVSEGDAVQQGQSLLTIH